MRIAVGVFLALYALVVPVVVFRYLSWLGPLVPGWQQADVRAYSLPVIRQLSSLVNQSSQPSDEVLAWWPGYVFETHARPVAGTENHGWMEIGSAPTLPRTPIATRQSIENALGSAQPKLVLLGIITPPGYRELAESHGYTAVNSIAGADVLSRP